MFIYGAWIALEFSSYCRIGFMTELDLCPILYRSGSTFWNVSLPSIDPNARRRTSELLSKCRVWDFPQRKVVPIHINGHN